jgi:hypothetical protein
MFTKQAADAIAGMSFSEADKQKLLSVLGDCTMPLEHRGPLDLGIETPNAPTIGVWAAGEGPTVNEVAASVINENHTSTMNTALTEVRQGFTNFHPGVSWFEWLMFDYIVLKNFEWVDIDVVTDVTLNEQSCTFTVTKETIRVFRRSGVPAIPPGGGEEGNNQPPYNNEDYVTPYYYGGM